jgi:quercetin dioxygenase-like cupin family protein
MTNDSRIRAGDPETPGSLLKEVTHVKVPRTLAILTALLLPALALGATGGPAAHAAAPGPTVPYRDSYPITVAAGDYELVYRVLDFGPGAGIPLHSHGGPTAMVVTGGELTLRANGMEHTLAPAATDNLAAGALHVMVNISSAPARVLVMMLLPKGAAVTTIVDTAATMTAPTVTFKGSYPLTVAAGDYALVDNVLDFAPGAEVPLHYHGGPAVIVDLDGELSIQAGGHDHMLKAGDLDTQPAGAQHVMQNMGATRARALFGVLLPQGAQLTTLITAPAAPVGMPSTGGGAPLNWLGPALAFGLLCLALGGYYRLRRVANR